MLSFNHLQRALAAAVVAGVLGSTAAAQEPCATCGVVHGGLGAAVPGTTAALANPGNFHGVPAWHRYARVQAQNYTWHGGYYDPEWGTAVAVVVPPTAEFETRMGWGVTGTQTVPIWHQYSRPWPGPMSGGEYSYGFKRPPAWPASTMQMGNYYIRGPW
jgi:hypothetical protein